MDFYPPGGNTRGRPLKYSPAEVERALQALARCGGNFSAAFRLVEALEAAAVEDAQLREEAREPQPAPPPRCIRDWTQGRFHGRYLEILSEYGPQLEEQIAGQNLELAMELHNGERAALARSMAGLASTDGVGASQILRNISQAKASNIQQAGQLRARDGFVSHTPGLAELARALSVLPGVTVSGIDAEGEVVELPTSSSGTESRSPRAPAS